MLKILQQMFSTINEKTKRRGSIKDLSDRVLDLSDYNERIERSWERFDCRLPILFEDYDTHNKLPGTIYNYSKCGMYIVSKASPQTGTAALVHSVEHSSDDLGPEWLDKYYVQVQWVNKVPESTESNLNGIGLHSCIDINQFMRLFSC